MKLFLAVILIAFLAGCTSQNSENQIQTSEQVSVPNQEAESIVQSQEVSIAGDATKYIRFSESGYEQALSEDKVVYLYFYANWCPICRAERPNILQAFNEMNFEDAVGFEVHYNDDEVTDADKAISKEFGIAYQHTTIILDKNGKEVFRSLSPVSKDMIKVEMSKARGM